MAEAGTKKTYNEFKYILFATPLAVVIFLLIMHLATRDRQDVINTSSKQILNDANAPEQKTSDLKLGDSPYTFIFGSPVYDTLHNRSLTIKNLSGLDVVICLFTKDEFVRCFYMNPNISAQISQLPAEAVYIYYSSGLYFNNSKQLKDSGVQGAFTKDLSFYKSINASLLNSLNELTLLQGANEGFEKINEKEFFKRAKK